MEPDHAIEIVQSLADGVDPYSADSHEAEHLFSFKVNGIRSEATLCIWTDTFRSSFDQVFSSLGVPFSGRRSLFSLFPPFI